MQLFEGRDPAMKQQTMEGRREVLQAWTSHGRAKIHTPDPEYLALLWQARHQNATCLAQPGQSTVFETLNTRQGAEKSTLLFHEAIATVREFLQVSRGDGKRRMAVVGFASLFESYSEFGYDAGHEHRHAIRNADRSLAGLLTELLASQDTPLSEQSMVMLMSDMGAGAAGTAAGRAHDHQPLLWLMLPGAEVQDNPDLQTVMFENGAKLVSPSDVYMTLHHTLYGVQVARTPTRGKAVSFAQQHGQSLLSPLPERSCGTAPLFHPGICGCGWQADCPGPRLVGNTAHSVDTVVKKRGRTRPVQHTDEAGLPYEVAFADYVRRSLDRTGSLVTCRTNVTASLFTLTGCPTPAILYDEQNRAAFQATLTDAYANVFVAEGHAAAGAVDISSARLRTSSLDRRCVTGTVDPAVAQFWTRCYCAT